ncbi:MAG: glycoside hydrolase family 13 protein, partial [Comamonadaceae bacterium]
MKQGTLQLMVHGERITDLTPSLSYPGLAIKEVSRVASPNYLFIDLEISKEALPGEVLLRFTQLGQTVLSQSYRLEARATDSAQRRGFGASDAIYLLMPDRFANGNPTNDSLTTLKEKANRSNPAGRHGGDLQGISEHLDYIAQMGFTKIWSTPLTENDQPEASYHGYATTNLYEVDGRYGSNEDYRELVSKARGRGLGFIQDVVLNHIGSGHWWMKDLPTADWLNFQDKFVVTNHKRTTIQDPHASLADRKRFSDGWFVESMPDMNQRHPMLANYLIQNTVWWIEYAGLSGLRVDTYPYSDPTFLSKWSKRIIDEYPNFNMVGEEWTSNPAIVSYWQKGKVNADHYLSYTPSMMDFPLYYALQEGLMGEDGDRTGLNVLYESLANDFQYPAPENLVIFEGNHDTSRIFSELSQDDGLYQMAMVYLATMRGIPQFFYGTEILMTSPRQRNDGLVRADFPGGWAGDAVNAFSGQGLSPGQREAQQFLRRLLNWRKSATVTHTGRLMHFVPEQGTYVYFRYDKRARVMVAFNKNRQPVTLELSRFHEMLTPRSAGTDVLSGQRISLAKKLILPAR